MGFSFVIQLVGLCHFIENSSEARHCQICVLLPQDRSNILPRPHEARLIFHQRDRVPRPAEPKLERLSILGQRVTFRFVPEPNKDLPPAQLLRKLKDTVVVDELLGSEGHPYLDFKAGRHQRPNLSMASVVLLQEGTLEEKGSFGPWRIPGVVGQRNLPAYTEVRVGPILSRVDVILTDFVSDTRQVLSFYAADGNVVPVTLTADCNLRTGRDARQLIPKAPSIADREVPDVDYRAHYLYLLEHASNAARLPVPIQLGQAADKVDAARRIVEEGLALDPIRFEFKIPSVERPFSGRGVYLDPRTGVVEIGAGGGSDCQNGRQKNAVEFDLDHLLP